MPGSVCPTYALSRCGLEQIGCVRLALGGLAQARQISLLIIFGALLALSEHRKNFRGDSLWTSEDVRISLAFALDR
jgi:hypothetical protein